jgi:hypothetical protein
MRCPECDRDNPPGSAFCGFCGRPMSQSVTSVTAARPGNASVLAQQPWAPEAPTSRFAVPGNGRRAHQSDDAATRYLCAAVSLSQPVRHRALDDVLEEEHRAVVTTPGVDLVTVLKYALAAHRRQVIRDIVLLVLLCGLIVSVFVPGSAIVFLLLLAAAWVTVCIERYANSRGAARGLRPETFRPDKAHGPARNSYADRQLKRIAAASATGNVTLYSKFPPFVGYGTVSTSWSFAVDVTKPRRGGRPRPLSVHEVYDCVKTGLSELDLPGMEVTDRVFVNGRDIRDDRRFLPDPHTAPVTSISADLVRELMATPEERARPYLTIGMTGWQGDLVATTFIRFLLSRSDLFVEAAHTVVPPLRAEFKAIDEQEPDMQPGEFFRLIGGALISTIPRLLGSITGIGHELGSDGRRERKRRRVDEAGDYGALLSVREEAADSKWQRYFQVLDDARYVKVIQQRIFRSLVEFLEEHDIDTSGLESRSETLVNNGVMVTAGGTVNAQAVAAGANAQAAGGLGAQAAGLVSRVRGGEGSGGQG